MTSVPNPMDGCEPLTPEAAVASKKRKRKPCYILTVTAMLALIEEKKDGNIRKKVNDTEILYAFLEEEGFDTAPRTFKDAVNNIAKTVRHRSYIYYSLSTLSLLFVPNQYKFGIYIIHI